MCEKTGVHMGYLTGYQYDVFISYAHVDNKPLTKGAEGWVEQFHESLKSKIAQQVGRDGLVAIWRDDQLRRSDLFGSSISEALQQSAILICVTSPGYMESEWCRKEYEAFCLANHGQSPPSHGSRSRIFNVKIRKIASEAHRSDYESKFGKLLGHEFYDADTDFVLSPPPPVLHDPRYWLRIEELARDIKTLLESMRDDARQESDLTIQFILTVNFGGADFDRRQADELVARMREKYADPRISLVRIIKGTISTRLVLEAPRDIYERMTELVEAGAVRKQLGVNAAALYPGNLHEIILQAKDRLIISGHTFNRFSHDDKIRDALRELLQNGVKVTLIMLNPKSKYAQAHAPYHELESKGDAAAQHHKSLEFLGKLYESLDEDSKSRFEVLLSNYMPRFRAIIVDDERMYLYFYMYGEDVKDYPDFMFEKPEQSLIAPSEADKNVFERVVTSTHNLIKAPEVIPYIRFGRFYGYWDESKLAKWDSWSREVRERHKITHQYYVLHAGDFHARFGSRLERYVQLHLDLLQGRALVLGCGSGKEVQYLAEKQRCTELYGVDFSNQAISLAVEMKQKEYPSLDARFIVADFYDLKYIVEGAFDSIVSNAAFVHLFERGDMAEMLINIREKLSPGGQCLLRNLYKEPNQTPKDEELFGHKDTFYDARWFVYYSRACLVELAEKAGFIVDHAATEKIAQDCWIGNMDAVMEKGFPHENYPNVYWPTLLLKKE